jgi:hypothetical protein
MDVPCTIINLIIFVFGHPRLPRRLTTRSALHTPMATNARPSSSARCWRCVTETTFGRTMGVLRGAGSGQCLGGSGHAPTLRCSARRKKAVAAVVVTGEHPMSMNLVTLLYLVASGFLQPCARVPSHSYHFRCAATCSAWLAWDC